MKTLLLSLLLFTSARAADLLLVVETTLPTAVNPALDQYVEDVRAEGWNVETVRWPARSTRDPQAHVRLAQQIVWPRAKASSDLHVLFVGALPIPYSGFNLQPDGHFDSCGAYATTLYYGCPDGKWSDLKDNAGFKSKTQHVNRPGDGKFDQQIGPGGDSVPSKELGKLRASIGFLDFSGAGTPSSWGSTLPNDKFLAQLYVNYFQRNHDYRSGGWAPKTLVGNGTYTGRPTGYFKDWAIATVGADNFRYFSSLKPSKAQPYSINDIAPFAVVYDFKALPYQRSFWSSFKGPWAVLDLSYGSYQIDFNTQRMVNPLVGGALATANSANGAWDLTGIFEGKTLGQLWYQTVNRGIGNTYCVLYGDPTITVRKI